MSCSLTRLDKCETRVMAVGDLHEPFAHDYAPDFLAWVLKNFRPEKIVGLGDEIDGHAISFHDHDPDGYSPGHELTAAIKKLQVYYQMFPEMDVCNSNHGDLPYRKALALGLPKKMIRSKREILDAPEGWRWADKWTVDGVVYEHGEGQSGQNAAIKAADGNMRPTVIGHIHSFAGIQYAANAETIYWGFNVGCLIDRHKYAFRYGKHFKRKPIIGVGLVEKGVPRFIPMLLDRRGRWVKRG